MRTRMSEEDLKRYGAEGAAMTLDEAVAYALGERAAPPTDEHGTPGRPRAGPFG